MPCFVYGDRETDYLKSRDPVLGRAIDAIGPVRREVIPDLFEALVHSIVGQQIATKAQVTIWNRMKSTWGAVTPSLIAALPPEEIQGMGISARKTTYIRQAAEKILDGGLNLSALVTLPDEEVCRELSSLNGVGVWTAEMLMIFSMQRPNILSFGDLAIQRGLRMLYRHCQIDRPRFERYQRRYSPCASVASLYLWAVAGGAIEGLRDPAAAFKH
ncbi:MAG: DNA-3-methyladenine glycosylase 2 family protein [Clostridiales bacterium]|jgi:DNA-3-methyladenine glycosylase II|nr:DNA-3-methyladenine glycosylase 2 family protein [Clostridiales bacterium]